MVQQEETRMHIRTRYQNKEQQSLDYNTHKGKCLHSLRTIMHHSIFTSDCCFPTCSYWISQVKNNNKIKNHTGLYLLHQKLIRSEVFSKCLC